MATATIKCPNCGGGLKFDPEVQKSVCEFCRSEFSTEALQKIIDAETVKAEAATKPVTEAGEGSTDAESTATESSAAEFAGYQCDNCGAEVVTDATTAATFCYYCHNPVLITDRLTAALKPDKIIPFKLDRDEAVKRFLGWAKRRTFVPKSFYSASQLEKMTGLYLPYWMADYEAHVDFAAQGVVRRTWVTGSTEFTESKSFAVARQGTIEVDHLHELAINKFDRRLIDSITPYAEKEAIDFNMSYLSGFFAERYAIERAAIEPEIQTKAKSYADSLLKDSISGYSDVKIERNTVDLKLQGWFYTLFPVWMITYLYKGKTYVYAINGQNGKTFGELPVNTGKLNLTAGLVAAGTLLLGILGGLWIW